MNYEQIAIATTTILAPFMPFLVEVSREGGKKLAETIAEQGGKAAWERAQAIWEQLKKPVSEDPKLDGAVTLVSAEPENETYLKILADALATQMQDDPEIAKTLLPLLGGQKSVQSIAASSGSWVKNITQETTGGGSQTIEARGKSTVQDIKQTRK